jgi:hypothetical protein
VLIYSIATAVACSSSSNTSTEQPVDHYPGTGGSSGTAGGTSTTGGGTAGTNAGSGGAGGTMMATMVDCQKDRPFQNNAEVVPDTRKTITGSNGTFTDECDAAGNLVEYACEVMQVCSGVPNPDCKPGPETGKVVSQNIDCLGHCSNGTCPSRCAQMGDLVHLESIGGASGRAITVRNLTDGRRYSCEDPSGPPPADPTCHAMSLVGRDIAVIQSGAPWCTGTFGGLTLDIVQNCGVPNCSDCAYVSCQVLY